ncbi:MAG: cobalt ECF transporter T component CbiQ [Anaerolineae bacterium]
MALSFLDRYSKGRSVIHRFDPRLKLILTLAFILAITTTPLAAWPLFLSFLALVISAILASGVPLTLALRRSMVVIPFALLVALSIPFTKGGRPVVAFHVLSWPLTVTDQGLLTFWGVVIKAWLSALAAGLLSASTPFLDMLWALRSLGLPKVMISIFSFMYRYLFVVVDEAMRLARARDSRSADPEGRGGGTILWQVKVLGSIIGTLFLRSYERSERIYAAMLSRGFAGEIRTLEEAPLCRSNVAATAVILLALVIIEILASLYW